jgi:hypothetical protein
MLRDESLRLRTERRILIEIAEYEWTEKWTQPQNSEGAAEKQCV